MIKPKQLRKLAFAAAITAAVAAYAEGNNAQEWANFNCYHDSNTELMTQGNPAATVVFMGNSITHVWPYIRPDFFKEHGYTGRGISGQTSYQFLLRFREDVINLHPQVVVINACTNDVAENTGPYFEDRSLGNIFSMAELARANGIKVILTSTLPAAAFPWNKSITDSSDKIASLNAKIRKYAEANDIPYVDYYSRLIVPDDPNRPMNPNYSEDGVHPNAAGYEIMEAMIVPVIDKILGKK